MVKRKLSMTEDSKMYLRNLRVLEQLSMLKNARFQEEKSSFLGMFLTKMELCPIWRRQILSQHGSFPKCEWRAQTPRYGRPTGKIYSSSGREDKTSKRSSLLEEWISMGTHTAECLWEVETGTNFNLSCRILRPYQKDNTVYRCFILRIRRSLTTRREWNQEINSVCIKIHG